MQQKQEKPTDPQNKDFFERRGVSKEIREKGPPGGKVLMPGGAGGRGKKFHRLYGFENIKKKYEATGKLDLEDFDNAQEIGMYLDWYNQGIKSRAEKEAGREITEISKFIARMINRTTIVLGGKPKK